MFQFKKFTIEQDKCAMKIGTDGVLIGAWTETEYYKNILDIGTGTGIIALMLAQRFPKAQITALEIDTLSAIQAQENINNSPWDKRINVNNNSLQKFKTKKKFDLIISNPPYFDNVSKPKLKKRIQSRHTDSLSFKDLFEYSVNNLSQKGSFSIIIPNTVKRKIIHIASKHKLFLQRLCEVRGNKNAPIKRVLMQFGFYNKKTMISNIIIEKKRHEYTKEYKELCGDFYLNM